MEIILRLLAITINFIALIVNTINNFIWSRQSPTYPPIRNKLLLRPVHELIIDLRQKKLTSVELVNAYIERIQEVNPTLNAVIEERFVASLKEAEHADQLIAQANAEQLVPLFARYPLLGIPCTIKESCGVKGMSFCIGNMVRKHAKCPQNGEVVDLLRAAGCIPLLVSANPEFCLSFETNTHVNGRCLNPYDLKRSTAGSSGGEGALNGAGASLFGLGSDISGSIRLPALFCGVFGHKPTGGITSVKGHFPYAKDASFSQILQLGPITRFARDLPLLLQVMAGNNVDKLKFAETVKLKDIKIFYSYGYEDLCAISHPLMAFDMKLAITKAVKCFQKGGLYTEKICIKSFRNSFEVCVANLVSIKSIPSIMTQSYKTRPSIKVLIMELIRSIIGHSFFTKEALFMEIMQRFNAFIPEKKLQKYIEEAEEIKTELTHLLGNNGVLLFPSYHTSALHFNTSIFNLGGIDMLLLFNVLGLPATQVPMGFDEKGLPIGLQVVAAPYQDKLCLQIAAELEGAFGGWEPPIKNDV